MARWRTPKSKDPATKNTLNPPSERGSQVPAPQTIGRQVGQYTGEGVPSLQKK